MQTPQETTNQTTAPAQTLADFFVARLESHKDEANKDLQDFSRFVVENPLSACYAITSRGRGAMSADATLVLATRLQRQITDRLVEGATFETIITEFQAELRNDLLYKPWEHRSSCPFYNVEAEIKASAKAEFLRWIENALTYSQLEERSAKIKALRETYEVLQQAEQLDEESYALLKGVTKPRSKAAKSDLRAEAKRFAYFVAERALEGVFYDKLIAVWIEFDRALKAQTEAR